MITQKSNSDKLMIKIEIDIGYEVLLQLKIQIAEDSEGILTVDQIDSDTLNAACSTIIAESVIMDSSEY